MHTKQDEMVYTGKCIVCGKIVPYYYGRWSTHGTCSKKCEEIEEAKPKYPDKEK